MGVTENVKRPAMTEAAKAEVRTRWGAIGRQYPLVVERDIKYGFGPPTVAPWSDGVAVWRLPPINDIGGGLLYLPENRDEPNVVGVLVAWGLRAMEQLQSQGIALGQHVVWQRFAGWEHDDQTPEIKRCSRYLWINAHQVVGSIDVQERLVSGELSYVTGDDGKTRLQQNLLPEMKKASRRAKLTAVANSASAAPQERETAKRILNRKR